MNVNSNKLSFSLGTILSYNELISLNSYNDGLWHHFVGIYDGAYMRIYIDGEEKRIFARTEKIKDSSSWNIGGATRFFNGQIDEVMLYNRALSANEVKGIYCSQGGDPITCLTL